MNISMNFCSGPSATYWCYKNLTILNILLFNTQFIDIILLFQGIYELFNVPEEKYV